MFFLIYCRKYLDYSAYVNTIHFMLNVYFDNLCMSNWYTNIINAVSQMYNQIFIKIPPKIDVILHQRRNFFHHLLLQVYNSQSPLVIDWEMILVEDKIV